MKHGHTFFGRFAAAVLVAALGVPCAFALNTSLEISQYVHTAWTVDEGFSKGAIHSIAQTADGYLWLGTEFGLLRFDGVRAVPWSINDSLPSTQVRALLAASDGTLWIGTSRGLVSTKIGSGDVRRYKELDGQTILGLTEDRAGYVWTSGWSSTRSVVCSIRNYDAQCYRDNSFRTVNPGIYVDKNNNVWVGVANGLWRWAPGPRMFYSLGQTTSFDTMTEDENGGLLFAQDGAIKRFAEGHTDVAYALPAITRPVHIRKIFRDRDGGLWIGTLGRGIVHIHQGRSEVFARSSGLSGDDGTAIFEDRQGTIWIGTLNGLDRFRETPVMTYSEHQGLSSARIVSVLAAKEGSIWMRTLDGLDRWKNGNVSVFRVQKDNFVDVSAKEGSARFGADLDVPEQGAGSLYEDYDGRVWVTAPNAIGYMENDRFVRVRAIPGGRVHSIVRDRDGNMWFAHQDRGLIRWTDGKAIQETAWTVLGDGGFADALAADPKDGGLWIGLFRGGVLYFKDGKILKSFTSANGLGKGRVNDFRLGADGTLWIATEGGLTRLKNGRLATLTTKNGLPCDGVHWVIEDNLNSVWLYTVCGLVRIPRPELDAAAAAIEKGNPGAARMQTDIFDSSDGMRSRANAGGFSPHVTKSADGKLWFFPLDGLSSVDPARLALYSSPPPAHIEQLQADRITQRFSQDPKARLMLPPLVRDLEIEYTAINLAAPEKLRFRYMLEGRDHDWTVAGTRRQAFYNDLPPGNYRFDVSASNNNGVWSQAGAALDFRIAPAYHQTRWFQALCGMALVMMLGMLYQLRLRQVAQRVRIRTEERLNERTRIARDLHDTLLQSLQALLLNFVSVAYLLPNHPVEARNALEGAIEDARQAITEGRDAVEGLRLSRHGGAYLEAAIGKLGRELPIFVSVSRGRPEIWF